MLTHMPSDRRLRAFFNSGRRPLSVRDATMLRHLARTMAPGATLAFVCVAAATYLTAALAVAAQTPFWSDEILAVWVARLPSAQAITQAIWHGAEFSPPTYDLLLHLVFQGFGSSPLAARLPSILAVLYAAGVVAWIVRRRMGNLSSALAFGLILNSSLFEFAVQARPYALLIALVATLLAVWSDDRRGLWRPVMLGVLLFAGVSLHVYAVVVFAAFALMETLVTLRSGRIRPPIWLAFAGAAAASLAWLPLIRHLSGFNSGDVASPDFYGAPTLQHLIEDFELLFLGSTVFGMVLLAAALLVVGACAVAAVRPAPARSDVHRGDDADMAIMAAGLVSSLPVGFLLALVATHVFSARYALPATLGGVLFVVLALARIPYARVVGVALCVVLAVLPLLRATPASESGRAIALLAGSSGPVVVSDSNLFIELMENAPPALRSRLVHLTKPSGVVDGDTSADHQLQRLVGSFRPDLPLAAPDAFMAAHERFTEVCRPGRPTDALCAWLVAKGRVEGAIGLGSRIAVLNIGGGRHAEHP